MSLFDELAASLEPIEMDSYCVACESTGKTRMLMTKVPFFKEIIVSSFQCEECAYRNTEVTFGGKMGDYGMTLEFTGKDAESFKRDIVKSEFATLTIPEVGLEIPKGKGQINTIEGVIQKVIDDLSNSQEDRRQVDPDSAAKIDEYLVKLRDLVEGKILPYTFTIRDPSGNSYIRNPFLPKEDPNLKMTPFNRTREDLEEMGFVPENAMKSAEEEKDRDLTQINHEKAYLPKEIGANKASVLAEDARHKEKQMHELKAVGAHRLDLTKPLAEDFQTDTCEFEVPCDVCSEEGKTRMCTLSIPYFKDLIIMSFSCDHCGSHNAEVKSGGQISKCAKKITIKVEGSNELRRDMFKSDTATVIIPEVGLELVEGTLGSVYTTVEGLLEKIIDNLKNNNPFVGDSSDLETKGKLQKFYSEMENIKNGMMPFTLILDDPLADCFIQNPNHPNPDDKVVVEEYERTEEQLEALGMKGMKVD